MNYSRKSQSLIIFAVISLFYFYQMILQVSPDVIAPYLIKEFSVNEHRLGLLTSAYFFSYMLMQIPAGILLDRFGTHRTLFYASILCSLGAFLFSVTPYFFLGSIARLCMGVGGSFAYLGGLKLISEWFSERVFTIMMGLLASIGMLGGIIGEARLAQLIEHIGWRETILLISLLGFTASLLIFLFIKKSPTTSKIEGTSPSFFQEGKKVFHNKQLWLASLYTSIVSMIPYLLTSLYGVPFLIAKCHIDELLAAHIVSYIFLGFMIGGPIWGFLSDYIKRRIPSMYIAAIAMPVILYLLFSFSFSNTTIKLLLFSLGFLSCGSITAFTIVYEINRPQYLGTALGIINMFDNLGVTLMLPLFGRFLDFFGKQEHLSSNVYGLTDYISSLKIVMIISIISLIFLKPIKETYAKKSFSN